MDTGPNFPGGSDPWARGGSRSACVLVTGVWQRVSLILTVIYFGVTVENVKQSREVTNFGNFFLMLPKFLHYAKKRIKSTHSNVSGKRACSQTRIVHLSFAGDMRCRQVTFLSPRYLSGTAQHPLCCTLEWWNQQSSTHRRFLRLRLTGEERWSRQRKALS